MLQKFTALSHDAYLTPMLMPLGPSAIARSADEIPSLVAHVPPCKIPNCFLRNMVLLSASPVLALGTFQVHGDPDVKKAVREREGEGRVNNFSQQFIAF